ncbi:Translation initiation factor IF-2 [Phytophthora citrophthora]|uniref:Translation initiation factor IF-2 n=1 Tax=Phytophthora citrophthora TaxID=4793 RepID=A0AAD9GB15_9STRA|nr:Translation initiation factor IF-2 [Phytophthora citrophthora]
MLPSLRVFSPTTQLLLPVSNGTRWLRTARGGTRRHKDHMARIAALEAQAQEQERARQEQRQRVLDARNQPPAIPAFIRVRDLAKALRQPLDKVLKKTVTKANRRFHLKTKNHPPAEFRSVKHIVLPFRVAQEVAESFGIQVAYDDVEPELLDVLTGLPEELLGLRQPVIAVMGHVDHGKTTLMDTLRKQMKAGLKQIAPYEKHGITQKINVCEAALTSDVKATFLDTPGHFHFFRMRTSAAQVADAVLLIVAADEGVLLQTEESIGAIEEAGLPAVICINKVDLLGEDDDGQVDKIVDELRSFVALQDSPVLTISGKTGAGLDDLKQTVWELVTGLADERKLDAVVGSETHAEGLVLESVALKGRGTVLRVLIKNGELEAKQHFVAGMIHGVVRGMRDAEGRDVKRALPGTVVDITYSNKSKNVDAPNEHGFFVLPEARAKQVMEQRELALEFNDCLLPDENGVYSEPDAEYTEADDSSAEEANTDAEEDDDDIIDENDLIETKSIIVKADGAGSLTSIQDTVDEMTGISTARLGIGNISTKDIDVAINGKCPIFGFNVKLRKREAKLASERGVRIILRSTVHELIEEITTFEQADADDTNVARD